jgi:hypothetical protein
LEVLRFSFPVPKLAKTMQKARRNSRPAAAPLTRRRNVNPPPLVTRVQITRTFRFRSTGDAQQAITQTDLLGVCGGVCTVANTTVTIFATAVKLHRVSIWTPPASQGAAATCGVEWSTPSFNAGPETNDTTLSVATPAHVSLVPPVNSAASFWLAPGTDAIMVLTAPTGSVIDVHATWVLSETAGVSYTVAAGTLGSVYYLPLDGAGDVYLPVGLVTTT